MKYRQRTISELSRLVPEIVYVMCGARGETSPPFTRALPQLKFIGFEPDWEEYNRLISQGPAPHAPTSTPRSEDGMSDAFCT